MCCVLQRGLRDGDVLAEVEISSRCSDVLELEWIKIRELYLKSCQLFPRFTVSERTKEQTL